MNSINYLSNIFEKEIQNLELPQTPANLYKPIEYILESGGKRIRPVMVLITASMYGASLEKAIKAALAIEVFHNFTLLHDDIMDNASVRRGKPTVHKKWSDNIAILSGDAMVIHSYKLLSQSANNRFSEVLEAFNTLAALVCEGQQMDMDFEDIDFVSTDDYINMITLKTSALIAGALKIGALISGAALEECDKLYEIGINLGIAFQLQDDLLDTYGDESIFGKKIGGDIIANKKTFLLLNAINESSDEKRDELKSTISSTTLSEIEIIERVKDIYDSLSIKEKTENRIEFYYNKAIEIIDTLTIEKDKLEPINELAKKLVIRDK